MVQAQRYVRNIAVPMLLLLLGLAFVQPGISHATDTIEWGGGGGNPFRDECPIGSYLVGLKGRAGSWIDRIAPVCAPWRPDKLNFGAPTVGQFHGTSRGGVEREQTCWRSGVNNLAIRSWDLKRLSSDNFLEVIKVECTSLAPPIATRPVRFVFAGPITEDQGTNIFDKAGKQGADSMNNVRCPPGELAIGIHGRAGQFLDSIGLICGPLPPKFAPAATNVNPLATAPTGPATKANPLAKLPVPAADMFLITRPAPGDRVQQGQLVVTAQPPKIGAGAVTVLELKWLDAPPGQSPSSTFAVETSKLIQGVPIDPQMTQGRPGRWEVRARISAQPTPGPWSFPVQFQLFQTQPVQSQQQAPPPMIRQAPLPGSSVMQAPAPSSSATTQMRRSPSMIMPRGVDEKEASGEGAGPTEHEKKP